MALDDALVDIGAVGHLSSNFKKLPPKLQEKFQHRCSTWQNRLKKPSLGRKKSISMVRYIIN